MICTIGGRSRHDLAGNGGIPLPRQRPTTRKPHMTFRRYPAWWKDYCPSTKTIWWEDRIVLKSQSEEYMIVLNQYFKNDTHLVDHMTELYHEYHIVDTTRPVELRTLDLSDPAIIIRQMKQIFIELWKKIRPEIKQVSGDETAW